MFEDRVFLAMEYVEGATMRRWLRSGTRSDADILDKYIQALGDYVNIFTDDKRFLLVRVDPGEIMPRTSGPEASSRAIEVHRSAVSTWVLVASPLSCA